MITTVGEHTRVKVVIRGAVQGVGFRPFVYRLAGELQLKGWVSNTSEGVFIEVEGDRDSLNTFLRRLQSDKPPRSSIQSLEHSFLDLLHFTTFQIKESRTKGQPTTLILPDIATCPDCLREIFDATDRRYMYPFTNCTNCGPRFSIIESLPYDRCNTSMKKFEMCPDCGREYENPLDRRFHAQPNACPTCGPHLELWDVRGDILADGHVALLRTVEALRSGRCVAVKGIGGFLLAVDAANEHAVQRLRRRKRREEKPFALLFPDIASVKNACLVSEMEERLLLSPESPIVLLTHRRDAVVAPSVAPNNPYLGVMLPYSPLHYILMEEIKTPLVATSGNLSDEPICTEEHEALERLRQIADLFLVHNRPIVRHVDDSIVRIVSDRELVLRRARGYAPLPLRIREAGSRTVVAVGAHLKNTVAMNAGHNVFISQHIGDLETAESYKAFTRVLEDFQVLFHANPDAVVCDAHPDYLSTKYARQQKLGTTAVQHHYAHVAACMMENELEGELLGVSWDGTGFGLDGTVWGGEFLRTSATSFERAAAFRTFRLPGGDLAIREPRRAALGLLVEALGAAAYEQSDLPPLREFNPRDLAVIRAMLEKRIHSPLTSSAGRLFDAVASISGIRQIVRHEGQAAMELEFALPATPTDDRYDFSIVESPAGQPFRIVDWSPMVTQLLDDVRSKVVSSTISLRFHNMLVEIIVEIARQMGESRVVLTGGCFQNKYLLERSICRLREAGFAPYWHQRIPPNDGGISIGQMYAFLRSQRVSEEEVS